MSLLGLVGDIHARGSSPVERVDDYVVVQYQKLRQAFDHFKRKRVSAVIAPGDLFNNYGRDTYDVLYSVIDLLKEYGFPVYTVFGQHDIRFHNLGVTDTPMQILIKSHLVWPLRKNGTMVDNGVCLFGANFGEPLFKVPNTHKKLTNIMVMHKMIINGKKLWPGQTDYSQARVLERKYGYDLYVCGDNHQAFVNGKVLNCGSLMRMNIDQAKHKPMYALYDPHKNKLKTFEYDIAPANLVLKSYDSVLGNIKGLSKKQKKEFAESLNTDYEGGTDYKNNIHGIIKKKRRVRKRAREIIEKSLEV